MSVLAFLLTLYATIACLGAAAVVAGWLIAECLNERDRRQAAKVEGCSASSSPPPWSPDRPPVPTPPRWSP